MKNKLNLKPSDARKIHDEFYQPDKLLEESTRPTETKRPNRPTQGVKGITNKPRR